MDRKIKCYYIKKGGTLTKKGENIGELMDIIEFLNVLEIIERVGEFLLKVYRGFFKKKKRKK